MQVTAVIPNWNGLHYLQPLLASMEGEGFTETVLVDNGSTDGSVEWAVSRGVRVIRFPENRGFAAAVNAGVAAAHSEAIAILNNDVRLHTGWLQTLVSAVEQGYPIACGKVISESEPETIDGAFDAVCRGGTAWRCGQGRKDGEPWNRSRAVQFAPLTTVLIRREVFRDAGGLDEAFGSYLEDVDFGFRCAARGHSGVYVPGAVASHVGSGTLGPWSARTVRLIARNQLLLIARHYPSATLRRFVWQIALAQLLWGAVAAKNRRFLVWLIGKLEGLRDFRAVRTPGWDGIDAVLTESEQTLRSLQRETGMDTYWRLYFALTRS